ncbi:hypothetical protein RB200_13375 [Streptomyces sp. PmtG]
MGDDVVQLPCDAAPFLGHRAVGQHPAPDLPRALPALQRLGRGEDQCRGGRAARHVRHRRGQRIPPAQQRHGSRHEGGRRRHRETTGPGHREQCHGERAVEVVRHRHAQVQRQTEDQHTRQ